MKFYEPIGHLGNGKRRLRRSRYTFGLIGVLLLGLAIYWAVSAYRGTAAQARTDRIIALSSPDFTEILSAGTGREGTGDSRGQDRFANLDWAPDDRPYFKQGVIQPDETLFVAMRDVGIDPGSIQAVVDSFQGTFDFRRCRPGDQWESQLDEQAHIVRFRYSVSPEEVYESTRQADGTYLSARLQIPTEVVIGATGGTVISSVYEAMAQIGEGTVLATRFMDIFGWDIDFSKETRPGDTFRMVLEKVYLDGEFLRYGRILAAEYLGRSIQLRAYAATDQEGNTSYYTADGQSLQRDFLRAPLRYRRISSPFSWRRFHPILHRYRPHLGVDYAAPSGTPVWAIADGRISFAGTRGGNGNLIVIHHEDGYESIYAHLSRFARGMHRGVNVHQGEVIGYVGSTGVSTGPHLHFGMRRHGEYFDPLTLEARRTSPLEDEPLQQLQETIAWANQQLDAIAITPADPSLLVWEEAPPEEELVGDYGLVEGFIDEDMTELGTE